jgi:hypothetical protein
MLDKKGGAARRGGILDGRAIADLGTGHRLSIQPIYTKIPAVSLSVSARRARGPLEKLTSAQRRASNFNIKILYRYSVVTLLRDRRDRNIVRTDNVIARSWDESNRS